MNKDLKLLVIIGIALTFLIFLSVFTMESTDYDLDELLEISEITYTKEPTYTLTVHTSPSYCTVTLDCYETKEEESPITFYDVSTDIHYISVKSHNYKDHNDSIYINENTTINVVLEKIKRYPTHWELTKTLDYFFNISTDFTIHDVKRFVREDKTDEQKYDRDNFNCEDFSFMLMNNGREHEFKTGLVTIYTKSESESQLTHAIVVFDAKYGKVFVDPQLDIVITGDDFKEMEENGEYPYCANTSSTPYIYIPSWMDDATGNMKFHHYDINWYAGLYHYWKEYIEITEE